MHLQVDANGAAPAPLDGPLQGPEKPYNFFHHQSSSLPFGQEISMDQISGPTYVTSQTLMQQVAYALSDRLWTYSPDTFDLDVAVKRWFEKKVQNARGYTTNVQSMEVRLGAASIALGYIFSPDFDLKKRHVPHSIIASSSSLQYLRSVLDQLSLLYSIASPFVAHIAAIDYTGHSNALVTDYVSALTIADELSLGVVASFSPYESQHMSLFATLLATVLPTLHLYDGIRVGRETTRVIDVLEQASLYKTYQAITDEVAASGKKNDPVDVKVDRLLRALNGELGTEYGLFEYQGHATPDAVLIVFGTVESSLASQVAQSLERDGAKVGVINVRVYRPFVEGAFLEALPRSVKTVGVLGQVLDEQAVSDPSSHSNLYSDVLAALTFSDSLENQPTIIDIKYPREQSWTPISLAASFQLLTNKPLFHSELEDGQLSSGLQIIDPATTQQYTFWDVDESSSTNAPMILAQALSKDSANNVTVRTSHDNLVQGGVNRTDIRRSKMTIESSFSVEDADVVYIGDTLLLTHINVTKSLKYGGKIILRAPGITDNDLEKQLPVDCRKSISDNALQLYVLDTKAIDRVSLATSLETYLIELAFIRIALPSLEGVGIQKLSTVNGDGEILGALAADLDKALRQIEIPDSWATIEVENKTPKLRIDITINSFTPFDKMEPEPATLLKSWQTAAKGLIFKEAFGTKPALRPDLSVKTFTVHVQENRRLTPIAYDRNIFHIEFDLGDSGLKYEIGEALGIHAENHPPDVEEFMKHYELNAEDIVEVPSREDPMALENRTIYQALMQNVDLWGRPPKRFYESLAEFAMDPTEKKELLSLGGLEGITEFRRRAEIDTVTYADVLLEFPSARPSFHDIVRIVSPMKRREYSIASCQKVTPTSVALMIVAINWVDPKGRDRWGQATRYLKKLRPGAPVTVSVKPSVMKLPPKSTQPIVMAGLGTGLAPFRAFVQHRAWEKAQGHEIGPVLLYMGSRHQREEYCYGEEWEAYQDAGVITLLGRAFSRDQPQKIYIQDRMRESLNDVVKAYQLGSATYLCGPTWPVPDVTHVLEEVIARDAAMVGKKVDTRKEVEKLKDAGRYVLEVY